VALSRSTRDIVGSSFTLNTRFAFGHGCDHPSYVPRVWRHGQSSQSISFVCSVRRGQRQIHRNGRADLCPKSPPSPAFAGSAGKAILPCIHDRCCNSHFEREVIRGHSLFVELNLNPICHAFHACRQGFRLRWFPCVLREFDRNTPVCKTQQCY
jgi:hypothetical protein